MATFSSREPPCGSQFSVTNSYSGGYGPSAIGGNGLWTTCSEHRSENSSPSAVDVDIDVGGVVLDVKKRTFRVGCLVALVVVLVSAAAVTVVGRQRSRCIIDQIVLEVARVFL